MTRLDGRVLAGGGGPAIHVNSSTVRAKYTRLEDFYRHPADFVNAALTYRFGVYVSIRDKLKCRHL